MTTRVDTIEEFLELVRPDYEGTKFEMLPALFAELYEQDKQIVVVAKGKTRNEIHNRLAMMTYKMNERQVVSEPRYGFMKNVRTKSMIKFVTTGNEGLVKLKIARQIDTILLYGVDDTKKEWIAVSDVAGKRSYEKKARLIVHYA